MPIVDIFQHCNSRNDATIATPIRVSHDYPVTIKNVVIGIIAGWIANRGKIESLQSVRLIFIINIAISLELQLCIIFCTYTCGSTLSVMEFGGKWFQHFSTLYQFQACQLQLHATIILRHCGAIVCNVYFDQGLSPMTTQQFGIIFMTK